MCRPGRISHEDDSSNSSSLSTIYFDLDYSFSVKPCPLQRDFQELSGSPAKRDPVGTPTPTSEQNGRACRPDFGGLALYL
jgi:hypothetical protein